MDTFIFGTRESHGTSELGPNSRCTTHAPPPHTNNPVSNRSQDNLLDAHVMNGYIHPTTKESNGISEYGPNSRCTMNTPLPHTNNPLSNLIQDNLQDLYVMNGHINLLNKRIKWDIRVGTQL